MSHLQMQEEQEVRLHPHRLPGGLHESELALELRGQLVSAMPWAPEVPLPPFTHLTVALLAVALWPPFQAIVLRPYAIKQLCQFQLLGHGRLV